MSDLRPRHERFCRLFLESGNAARAARGAGYHPEWARNAGYRLLKHPQITARIAALLAELGRSQANDLNILLGKLEAVYRISIDDRQFVAATKAVELQAKLAGLSRATGRAESLDANSAPTSLAPAPGRTDSATLD